MSQSPRSASFVEGLMRLMQASLSACDIFPFSTNLTRLLSMPATPFSRNFRSTSTTTVSTPACAAACAMPDPTSPEPTTPTCLISAMLSPLKRHILRTNGRHPPQVIILGLVSLLNDAASEMIYPLLPVFQTATL